MAENNLQKRTVSSLIWKLFERFGAQLIQFVVGIVLARLLMPEDYGAIALITVFIAVANVFTQSGFSAGLIRKLDADELDYSSVFWSSLVVSVLIYIILFFTAPVIADFYELPILKNVLRVLSLTVIVGTYNSIQNAILSKNLMFKKLFISSFSSVLISGVIGIVCAYYGLGIWALCAQQLSAVVITTIVMNFTVKWHPKFIFSWERVKILLSFGWKLLFSGVLDVVYNNLYSLVIGKKYSPDDLAYWNRGKQFPDLIVNNINGSISAVMYPVYSMKQDNIIELKQIVRRSIKLSGYLVFPMMVGLAVIAEPLVRLLLTDKWLFCVPFLQAWCIIYAFMPIHTTNLQVYNALGRSDIFLWLEIIKKFIGVVVLFITLPYGLEVMIYAKIGTSVLSSIINALPNIKILHYSIKEQLLDLIPMMLMSAAMGGIVYATSLIPIHYVAVMVIEVIVGIISYLILSMLIKPEPYVYCKDMIVKGLNKIKNKNSKNNLDKNNSKEEDKIDNANDNRNMKEQESIIRLTKDNYIEYLNFLKEVDKEFYIHLSQRVNLDEYAKKLLDLGVVYAYVENNKICGAIAGYINDINTKSAFVSTLAVKPQMQNKKIGQKLTGKFIEESKNNGMETLDLEVYKEVVSAIKIYEKYGFEVVKEIDSTKVLMRKKLKD